VNEADTCRTFVVAKLQAAGNKKTIFFFVIDIFDYPLSASKRGKLQAYEITPQQFVESLS